MERFLLKFNPSLFAIVPLALLLLLLQLHGGIKGGRPFVCHIQMLRNGPSPLEKGPRPLSSHLSGEMKQLIFTADAEREAPSIRKKPKNFFLPSRK